ncbi:sel1 repeat family protein [Horticoccus luteus]|uniref:Sel1 repeat family protein n=1 Tax=Horticoccus luteus TaxID=2862869 RepID=A0A8F9XIS2_9BACT|nr:tetratricopeptide repeat protein [Horticoccus luteus]QYM80695.1 sel1 repeat family protein [Horticoccus luteus]
MLNTVFAPRLGWRIIWIAVGLIVASSTGRSSSGVDSERSGLPADIVADAEAGDASAQFLLGCIYARGERVEKDVRAAVSWISKSALQGYALAQVVLVESHLSGNLLDKNHAEAVRWAQRFCQMGHVDFQRKYGRMVGDAYYSGKDVTRSFETALEWYTKAAELGDMRAEATVGLMYFEGQGVRKNYHAGLAHSFTAAKAGDAAGIGLIGIAYSQGLGVPKNEVEGLAWMNVAAAAGYPEFVALREQMEKDVGRQLALQAQQRSQEISDSVKNLTLAPPVALRNTTAPAEGPPIAPRAAISPRFRKAAQDLLAWYDGLLEPVDHPKAGEQQFSTLPLLAGCRNPMKWEEERVSGLAKITARDAALYYVRMMQQISLARSLARGAFMELDGRCTSSAEKTALRERFDEMERLEDEFHRMSFGACEQIEAELTDEKTSSKTS